VNPRWFPRVISHSDNGDQTAISPTGQTNAGLLLDSAASDGEALKALSALRQSLVKDGPSSHDLVDALENAGFAQKEETALPPEPSRPDYGDHPDHFEVFSPPGSWRLDEHRCETCSQSLTFGFDHLTNPIPTVVHCACAGAREKRRHMSGGSPVQRCSTGMTSGRRI
jgi:hypothetical protein